MRFYLFLLFFFSHYPFIFIINGYSTNNSVININLYQCNSNATILNTTIDTLFNNSIDSCNISCCTSNNLNNKSIYIEMTFSKFILFHLFSFFKSMSSIYAIYDRYLSWSSLLFWRV